MTIDQLNDNKKVCSKSICVGNIGKENNESTIKKSMNVYVIHSHCVLLNFFYFYTQGFSITV